GVECRIATPSELEGTDGALGRPVGTWQSLDDPRQRQMLRGGHGIAAREAGTYMVTWLRAVPPDFEPDILARYAVPLGPAESLDGWDAGLEVAGDELVLSVQGDSPERGLLNGFRCTVTGPTPGSPFTAEDGPREWNAGLIEPLAVPSAKARGEFRFP